MRGRSNSILTFVVGACIGVVFVVAGLPVWLGALVAFAAGWVLGGMRRTA